MLPGVSAFGDSIEEALLEYSKALTGCMEVMLDDGDSIDIAAFGIDNL